MIIKPEQLAGWSETSQQQALFAWAAIASKDYPQLKWLHAIPNANSHRMVAEGVRGGISDIFFPLPIQTSWGHQFAGLYLEMKIESRRNHKDGGCSKDQLDFIDYAKSVGYSAFVCYGWIEAKEKILQYLKSCEE